MRGSLTIAFMAGLGLAVAPCLRAEVLDSSSAGFTVRSQVTVAKPSGEVYKHLVDDVGSWWSSAHTFSENAGNLSIDDRPGGCFCEKLPAGGQVRHLEVVYADPGRMLRMTGGLGPLQGMAVTGVMTITLKPESGATQVEFRYSAGGYAPGGLEAIAAPVDQVIGQQLTRLKNFSETGTP